MKLLPTVWPSPFIKGIRTLEGPYIDRQGEQYQPETGKRTDLREALDAVYKTPACITCYAFRDETSGETCDIPLFKKGIERELKENNCGVYSVAVGIDWDTPGHIPLTPALFELFCSDLSKAEKADNRLATWMCMYTTRHGARLIYDLTIPVEVTDAESKFISMLQSFKTNGLDLDMDCKDWTRRFYLPKIVRDNIPTYEEPFFKIEYKDRKLDLNLFKRATATMTLSCKKYVKPENMPEIEQSRKELQAMGSQGRMNQTYFYKEAKKIINKSHFAKDILDPSVPLLDDRGRNEKIGLMLGYLVPILIRKLEANITKIFALFHEKLLDIDTENGKTDPVIHFWNYLVTVYDKEWSKRQTELENEARREEDSGNRLLTMAKGMRLWCDAPELKSEDQDIVTSFVRGRLFAFVNKGFFPMDVNGWYSDLCLDKEQLIPFVRKGYLKDFINTTKESRSGDICSITPNEIINEHSVVAYEIRASPLQGVRGRIEGLNTMRPVLWLPMYQRNDRLSAKWDNGVDGWLRALFGDYYDVGCKWIGYALSFEEGSICAISLTGASGTGKKMFSEGLSECLERPEVATGLDLVGKGTGLLLRTPFLVCNEGLPMFPMQQPSDTFKQLTAGDPITVRELYKPAINIINPVRIILTANDHEIHRDLTKGKEVSPETRKALGERLLHIPISQEAENYLISIGGREHTEKEGSRWIRGDSGEDSDYVVARHFLWLMEHRPKRNKRDRYCVMGNCGANSSFTMYSRTELGALVTRACIELVEGKHPKYRRGKVIHSSGRVWVSPDCVITCLRENPNREIKILENEVMTVLKRIQKCSTRFDHNGIMMVELDLNEMLNYAKNVGMPALETARCYERAQGSLV